MLAGLACCAVWLVSMSSPVAAQSVGEHIASFDSKSVLATDGSVDVTETIDYDFADVAHHGIERIIPTTFVWTGPKPKGAGAGATFDRVTPISDISVSASAETPAGTDVSSNGTSTTIRIGDPNTTITGQHTYVIHYRLAGVTNAFADHDELYLNATGNEWTVPIDRASVAVSLPASPSRVTCFAGATGSNTPCTAAETGDRSARFAAANLGPSEGLTYVVGLPKGAVSDPNSTRVLEERWSLASAFALNLGTGFGGAVVLLGGLAGIALLGWRNGRDRRFAGSNVDAAFGNDSGASQPVPLFDKPNDPVEFVPPEGIRPGHMGTLWDERASHLDVTAMIVDLAVRGWLRIDELDPNAEAGSNPGGRFHASADYQLVRLRDPQSDPQGAELLSAEREVLDSLFATGTTVTLSGLRTHFAKSLEMIESKLYDDAVAAEWFPTRPDLVRARWLGRGVALFIVGCGLVWLAAKYTHLGLLALPIPLLGVVLMASANQFPHRTAKGSALLGRVRGFKELFDAGEGERQKFAEAHHIFAQYLPYAIVFGCTEQWAAAFADLGLTPQEMGLGVWYTSPYGYNPLMFGMAMRGFTVQSSGSLAAAAPSSSGGAASGGSGFGGGFSGGGFGGGGGGSW